MDADTRSGSISDGGLEGSSSAGPSRSASPVSRRSASGTSRKGKERAIDHGDDQDEAMDVDPDSAAPAANGVTVVESPAKSATSGHGAHDTDDDSEGPDASDDEEEDEDEEEPTLKYSRLKGKLPEILAKDTASTIEVSSRVIVRATSDQDHGVWISELILQAIGTHHGMVHILTYEGSKVNSSRPHSASITSLRLDEENEFVATASVEGRVVIRSLTGPERYAFDYKRPMHAVALEPGFAKSSSRTFVCGGMAGNLIMQEKGWLGYKDQIIHSGEGPIWAIEWRGELIAWANDLGVKIYDTSTQQRIGYVDRGANAPRAELFKCSLQWKDDHTLVIGWADHIKVVRVRARSRSQSASGLPPLTVEMTAIYQVDCMVSGLAQYQNSFLVLAYISPDTYDNEATEDRAEQRRKAANPPELRLIDKGEELSADVLSLANHHMYGCNDYSLIKSQREGEDVFFVVSPSDVIVVRPRDEADHIDWLVDRQKFDEALTAAEALQKQHGSALDVKAIGLKYINHLISQGDFEQAASLTPKVLGKDADEWEKWIYTFVQHHQLPAIIPHIPVRDPQLGSAVYEMVFNHLLENDRPALLKTITTWPREIYNLDSLMSTIQSELHASKDDPLLLECVGELYLVNRQPGKALPYFLRLRRPHVFDLIREHNLFTAVQDQALLLVEFDQERTGKVNRDEEVESEKGRHGAAIQLLVDHTHSIPIDRVIKQLEPKPQYMYMYLDSLFDKDPQFALPYSDRLVELYAEYDPERLMPFLRASNFYDLEKALHICRERDYVPEMVFLLGRMGNNKQALMLIIERLGDVQRAIDFAKEQADEDLWEDLLQYSETRPDFIRALLEHVGAEINPIRLISRIRNGLEIPGLKPALIKVLQASNLQVSLLEGCQHILNSDCSALALELQAKQTGSAPIADNTTCQVCSLPAFPAVDTDTDIDRSLVLVYLCRHLVHATCALPHSDIDLPPRLEDTSVSQLLSQDNRRNTKSRERELSAKLSYAAAVRVRVGRCPVCELRNNRDTVRPALPARQSLVTAQA